MSTIQTFFPMLLEATDGKDWLDLSEKFTSNPRAILQLPVPEIKEGVLATLTVFDPTIAWTLDDKTNKSRSKNSPFYKKELKGKVVAVVNNGETEQF